MPASSAARSMVQGSARSRSWSAPLVCSRRNASSAKPVREEEPVDRERDGDVGARLHGQVHVGRSCERRRPRIDHDERRAALLRFAHVRDQVDAGRRRVDAPEDDQRGFRVVLIRDRRHLAVERHVGGAGRRGADRARQTRRAEPAPQLRVDVVLRQQAVRSAVRIRQNRLAPPALRLRGAHLLGDQLERFVPRHALELAFALAAFAHRRIEQPVGSVHALAEFPHLRADEAVGDRVSARAVDVDDAPAPHRHRQAAGIRAVERARGINDDGRPDDRDRSTRIF